MEVTLLGTAAPEGLPIPDCPCAACALAVGDGARAPGSVLVDGVVLLDLTPGVALAAARAGHSLAGLRLVLLSHPHDGPAVEIPPGLPAPTRVPDGQRITLITGHKVRAVPMDAPGTGYSVESPDGLRLLYFPPGCAPAGVNGTDEPPYDLVLLDAVGRPDALARLRAAGAVAGTTDVVAVHLGHDAPPEPELNRRLAAYGARAVPDGTTLVAGDYHAVPDVPRRTLVLGGARSGKSAEAERRLATFPEVLYVATGGTRDGDADWADRVALHRERRPAGWRTLETRDLVPLLADASGPPLLVDCIGLWLTDVLDTEDAWDDEAWHNGAARRVRARADELAAAWRATRRTAVAVSNEVGSGVVPATSAGRRFRDELGRLNAAMASESDHVLLLVAGLPLRLR
ncbi:bifunctional adenosylcobinamide kinase/adenosylcobinamide-phosphate guanylyltransferase [Streptomyces cocklensis]|uniref:Adenosylcobinamide kinase n=1 Tax=Actinacidiphila cocklensis TaxID=887465 RepID=A0A9W4GUG0_9ACTN|nr:bifunctional adenosylcobinamide kinase/adenosylcobinamide-phosphate guanylyltransferase [Actinacidiphila cocklensis]MDD1060333.1 bifunctional adenosylcobinamide kinase/adenosylcobinamide-phosphate guanylyltransferase [Actinacidiphila cocklensis]WSX74121.1 bifunctional adenosylcobinamide kinase/adenosylcobinamide-phosphate guanylyltransferase [Streptomyces sp. NBC_00899]WSX79815.1 bifunctional adenosylcobinamide kinase/adenosylcobinamide-phosphate guanylyltransferase [Streptomyces sp. NBC_0089